MAGIDPNDDQQLSEGSRDGSKVKYNWPNKGSYCGTWTSGNPNGKYAKKKQILNFFLLLFQYLRYLLKGNILHCFWGKICRVVGSKTRGKLAFKQRTKLRLLLTRLVTVK